MSQRAPSWLDFLYLVALDFFAGLEIVPEGLNSLELWALKIVGPGGVLVLDFDYLNGH